MHVATLLAADDGSSSSSSSSPVHLAIYLFAAVCRGTEAHLVSVIAQQCCMKGVPCMLKHSDPVAKFTHTHAEVEYCGWEGIVALHRECADLRNTYDRGAENYDAAKGGSAQFYG